MLIYRIIDRTTGALNQIIMHKRIVLLLLALIVQAAIGASVNNDVYLRVKPNERTLPKTNEQLSASQWTKLTEANRPKADNPKANPIVQPKVAGTTTYISKQIVGGSLASSGQFPWQALLYIDNAWLCGGSLILSQWVLTAAHCTGNSYRVYLGTISQSSLTNGYVLLTSTLSYRHEKYDDTNLNNDVTLIKLPSVVSFTSNISPVKLPSLYDATKNLEGTLATVSGFGRTSDCKKVADRDLKYTQVTVISYQSCASYYGSSVVVASTICTKQIDTSTCQGDSGGPLVYKDSNNLWVQIGVVSFGSSSGCLAGPSGFARVTSFLGWMSDKIGQDLTGTTSGGGGSSTADPTSSVSSETPPGDSSSSTSEMSTDTQTTSTSSAITTTTRTPKTTTTRTPKTTTTRTPKTTTTRTPKTTTTKTPKTTTLKKKN